MTDLTPAQYAVLKACAEHGVPDSRWLGTDELMRLGLLEARDNDSWGERFVSFSLSSKGYGALTVYEDEHATVRFDDLELLHTIVLRDSGDGSEQLHVAMRRISAVLGIVAEAED